MEKISKLEILQKSSTDRLLDDGIGSFLIGLMSRQIALSLGLFRILAKLHL